MIFFPAIDLKDGRCVRLLRGDMDAATVFSETPGDQAASFQDQGADWLHLVDLNGAFEGRPVNGAAVDAILSRLDIPVQLGGGIRDLATIEAWLAKGIARVILGTVAVRDPGLVKAAAKAFPGQVAVGIDAKGGMVAVEGWAEATDMAVADLAGEFAQAGVAAIIYTDGPNVDATAALARATPIPVIASGGVSSIDDLIALRDCGTPLEGAISGRAIYDGKIDVAEAVSTLKST